jgi:cysteine desulfurase/selenocysteine lyase
VAFATATDYVSDTGFDRIETHERGLLAYAAERLSAVKGLRIFGNPRHKSGVISFLVEHIHHYDMGLLLDRLGIAVRTGHHCAEPLVNLLGTGGTVRASFAMYNTENEIDILTEGIERVKQML